MVHQSLPPGRARIIGIGWRDARTGGLHARLLRAATVSAPGTSRRLAAALVELSLALLGAASKRSSSYVPPGMPVQVVAIDAWGQPVRIVQQAPACTRLLGACPLPYTVGALAE